MRIDIQTRGFTLTPDIRARVERQLRLAVGGSSSSITRALIRLSDENGPRGGCDKRCFLQLQVKAAPDVTIEQQETDLYLAISRCAERAGRTVARRVQKRFDRRRDPRLGVPPTPSNHLTESTGS